MPGVPLPAQVVLMVDIGGTHVKIKLDADKPSQRFASDRELTPREMVRRVQAIVAGASFDLVSIGYPGPVANGQPSDEPGNLGDGWIGYNFHEAFGKPVRIINDAALQALAAYEGGRVVFIGLGTGVGGALTVDGLICPIELGALRLSSVDTVADYLSRRALEDLGEARWREHAVDVLHMIQRAFLPDEIVIGGGNAKRLGELPANCRLVSNDDAYLGAQRLWGIGGVIAHAQGSSWRFEAHWSASTR